jgi:3-deoxy-D-manno-octulosonic-acid transferase
MSLSSWISERLYHTGILAYGAAIRIASLFSGKASEWQKGRRDWKKKLRIQMEALPSSSQRIWVHCASLGEFEQGRPIIEGIKQQSPETQIVLSFFSPSGYSIQKNYAHADIVTYLPLDTPSNAKHFIKTLQPHLAIFVKYEFWYFHLMELEQSAVPTFLISAIFRSDQYFFKNTGPLPGKILQSFNHIFVQDQTSRKLLQQIGLTKLSLAGDTRVDRVLQVAENANQYPILEAFTKGKRVLVAGSTWPEEEAMLVKLIEHQWPEDWRLILAPHEVKKEKIDRLCSQFKQAPPRFTAISENHIPDSPVLILDTIGMLSSAYRYGDIALIGGGFKSGIHNILEPAAHHLPVLFGPKHEKFKEAGWMIKNGGAFCFQEASELQAIFRQLQQEEERTLAGQNAYSYLEKNKGATETILQHLSKSL